MAKDKLDLHGMTVEEATDALDRFLTKAQAMNLSKITIISGKGSGKLQKLVATVLKQGGFPFKPEKLANGNLNEGAVVVFLD